MTHRITPQMGVLIIGGDHTIAGTNPSLAKLLKVTLDSIIGSPAETFLQSCLKPASFAELSQSLNQALQNRLDQVVRLQTNRQDELECRISPLIDSGTGSVTLTFSPVCDDSPQQTALLKHSLKKRTQELYFMYALSRSLELNSQNLEGFLSHVVLSIPFVWQHREAAQVCIVFDGREYRSAGEPDAAWRMRREIMVSGQCRGRIDVSYRDPSPHEIQEDFLPFEERVLTAIATRLGLVIERYLAVRQQYMAEARYRHLVEQLPVIVYMSSPTDVRKTYLSPQFEKLLDYPADITRFGPWENWSRLIDRADYERVVKEFSAWEQKREGKFTSTYRMRTRDDTLLWVHDVMAPIFSPAGGLVGYHGVIIDITEQKLLERTLAETESEFQVLFNTMPQAVLYYDPAGTIINANPAAEKILGAPLSHMRGASIFKNSWQVVYEDGSVMHPESYPVRQALRTERPVLNQIMGIRNPGNGEFHWLRVSAVPQFCPGESQPYIIYSAMEDITERKKVEKALQVSEAKFRAVVQNAWDGIVLLDEHGLVVEWNQGQERITGIPRAEAINRPLWEIQSEISIPERRNPIGDIERRALITGIVHNPTSEYLGKLVDQEYCHTNGSIRVMQSMLFPIEFDHTRLICSISRDVTEHRRVARAMEQHNRELRSLLTISQKLSAQHDFEQLLHDVCACIVEMLPSADAASLMLYDAQAQEMKPSGWFGYPDGVMQATRFPIDKSLVGRVLTDRQAYIIPNVMADPTFELLGDDFLDSVQSVLGVPMIVNDRLIGAIFVDNHTRPHAFDETDMRLMQSLAGQVTTLVDNTHLLHEVIQARENLYRLSRKLVEVQESERRRIARELHDEVGQTLTGLKLMLQSAASLPLEQTRSALAEIHAEVNDLMATTRNLSLALRPSILDDYGLLDALLWHFGRFGSQTGLKIEFQHHGIEGRRFAGEIETVAYRVIQEALTNITRHAQTLQALVTLCAKPNSMEIAIEDHGVGFDPHAATSQNKTFGLSGMRERVMLLGGEIKIQSAPGKGTLLCITLPLTQETV